MEAVAQLLRYIAHVIGQVRFEQFHEKIRIQLPEAEDIVMTIAEELRQEGRVEGRRTGQATMLEKQLTLKFGEISPASAARIKAATAEDLERYIERILTAETIEAVFAG